MVSVSSLGLGRPWSVSCLRPSPPMRFRDDKTSRSFKKTSKYSDQVLFLISIKVSQNLQEIARTFL